MSVVMAFWNINSSSMKSDSCWILIFFLSTFSWYRWYNRRWTMFYSLCSIDKTDDSVAEFIFRSRLLFFEIIFLNVAIKRTIWYDESWNHLHTLIFNSLTPIIYGLYIMSHKFMVHNYLAIDSWYLKISCFTQWP